MARSLPRKIWTYAQGFAGLGRDDVLLASFPRSGSTWVRFFLANLVSLREMEGRAVDFPLLDATMPELGVDDLRRPWPHRTIPRVVKTHRPASLLMARAGRRVLVLRDPRDAVVSLYFYEQGKRRPRYRGGMSGFLRHPRLGLPAWFRHHRSWAGRADLTLNYEDLVADARTELGKLLDLLGSGEGEGVVAEAVERSRFRNVRAVEATGGHTDEERFDRGFRFARRGGSGGWREHFSDRDREYYAALHRRFGSGVYPP